MELKIRVSNENGFVKEEIINLADKFQQRGITNQATQSTYISKPITEAGSVGVFLPQQQVNRIDYQQQQNVIYNSEVSVNIRVRYDKTDSVSQRWNIDVYADLHGLGLDWKNRILVKHCPQQVHKFPDSEIITVEWWVNGIQKQTYSLKRSEISSQNEV